MKWVLITLLCSSGSLLAQKPCDFSIDVVDSLGVYKSTKDYMMHERIFGGNSSFLYFSLIEADGMPVLNVQLIQKSRDFIKIHCLSKSSRLFLQLENGKVVTLTHVDQDNCGNTVRTEDGFTNRVTSGYFMFLKGTYEDLKKSPVNMLRIKFTPTETADFALRSSLTSELDQKTYFPENFFVDLLHCVIP
jgi:hypothetical protein